MGSETKTILGGDVSIGISAYGNYQTTAEAGGHLAPLFGAGGLLEVSLRLTGYFSVPSSQCMVFSSNWRLPAAPG